MGRLALNWIGLALAIVLLAISGTPLLPRARQAVLLLQAAEEPTALTALQLSALLTSDRIAAEIDGAVAAGDEELARSLLAVADEHGVEAAPDRRAAVTAVDDGSAYRSLRAFTQGAVSGQADGAAALAGVLLADASGVGDLRDILREGAACLQDQPCDRIILGLASVGLAATAATWAGGVGAPARGGLTLLKATHRLGRLSRPLTESLTRTVRASIDTEALRTMLRSGARLDLAAVRLAAGSAVRPASAGRLRRLGSEIHDLYGRTGSRGVMDALSLAHTPEEVGRVASLARSMGARTRGVLRLLGRAVLGLGAAVAGLTQTLLAAFVWVLGLACICERLGLVIGRTLWSRPKHRTPSARVTVAGALMKRLDPRHQPNIPRA
ncbi:hypothetical protein IPV08_22315 [Methylobacterium sp. SD274]|uniref:hypothetical protein n=1 Tax=Methylobacterium sp. SD274 TaxID=2782009 RepID=UPI001A96C42B|nr:hypothetical protein [Methylobacterium sp. SD274]MBO1022699.1 hypothetical protein [Methylobacterium sp. SD274]